MWSQWAPPEERGKLVGFSYAGAQVHWELQRGTGALGAAEGHRCIGSCKGLYPKGSVKETRKIQWEVQQDVLMGSLKNVRC